MSFVAEFNEGVRQRIDNMVADSKQYVVGMGVQRTGAFFRSIKKYMRYQDNEVERASITGLRHGFIQQTQGGIGSTVSMQGNRRKLTGGRPRLTISRAVDENIDELADFVVEKFADKSVDHINLGVKVRS